MTSGRRHREPVDCVADRTADYIGRRLSDPDLDIASIAAAHHISPRTMQCPSELMISNLGGCAGVQHRRADSTASGPGSEQVIGVVTYGGRLRLVCSGHARSDRFLKKVCETLTNASR
jgi:hypothetical protein